MIALLANPDSGSGEAGEVERLLRSERPRRYAASRSTSVDAAVAARPERIVVAGGDGSIGCAAEAAARAVGAARGGPGGHRERLRPGARAPPRLEPAVELAATGSRTARLDLGRAGERPFVNAASAGLSPVAARKAHGLKRALGPLAYTVGALRAGLCAQAGGAARHGSTARPRSTGAPGR